MANVENSFHTYFEPKIERLRKTVDEEFAEKFSELQKSNLDVVRRGALNIICQKGGKAELDFVRRQCLRSTSGVNTFDLNYLQKYGDWSDVLPLVNVKRDFSGENLDLHSFLTDSYEIERVKTIYFLGKSDILRLLNTLDDNLTYKAIKHLTSKEFLDLPNELILKQLHSENDHLRKSVCLSICKLYKKADIQSLLSQYLTGETYFYNVVHWLDLGCSLNRRDVQAMVSKL